MRTQRMVRDDDMGLWPGFLSVQTSQSTKAYLFGCRFLLLEDRETGDVLMPLIYMKPIFEANYSRKLSSLKNRLVEQPADSALAQGSVGQLYWIWAFESPQNVKLLVRQQLGEQNVSHVCPWILQLPSHDTIRFEVIVDHEMTSTCCSMPPDGYLYGS